MDDNANGASKKILVAGYYGFGNTGDEVILKAIIKNLKTRLENPEISVVSGDPDRTMQLHEVKSINWHDVNGISYFISKCYVVIIGGGGIFHDYWGVDASSVFTSKHIGISFYMSISLLAKLFKKPVILYSVGIGPLLTETGKLFTTAILKNASLIFVRDKNSFEEAINLGINRKRIHLTVDPAFSSLDFENTESFDNSSDFTKYHLTFEKLQKPILGVAVRNWDVEIDQDYWESEVAKAIDKFHDIHGGTSVFIPFQESQGELLDDGKASEKIQAKLRSKDQSIIIHNLQLNEKLSILSSMDIILGMRLHSLILAIITSTPFAGIIYDPKLENIFDNPGLREYSLDIKEVSADNLDLLMEKVYENHEKIRKDLKRISIKKQSIADKTNKFVSNWINDYEMNDSKPNSGSDGIFNSSILELIKSLDKKTNEIDSLKERILEEKIQRMIDEKLHSVEVAELTNEKKHAKEELKKANDQNRDLSSKIEQINSKLIRVEKTNRKLNSQLSFSKNVLEKLENQYKAINLDFSSNLSELEQQKKRSEFVENELNKIKGSRGWKILWHLWDLRLALFPRGSIVDRLLKKDEKSESASKKPKISRFFRKKINLLLSKHEYAFFLFKRKWEKNSHINLNNIQTSLITGLVSIILPVYNGEKYIREALESIFKQTYDNFELIVVDDGSTDSTRSILAEYENIDPRIHVIHQKNLKLPEALNTGFRAAKGEFWTWTSHDNRLHADFLAKMVHFLQKSPEVDMCYANMDIIDGNGNPLLNSSWFAGYQHPYGSQHVSLPSKTYELNTWPNNYIGGAFLYRGNVGWLVGEYSKFQFTREDYDYWMLVNSLLNLNHVDFEECIYDYRFHDDSLTEKDDSLNITRDRKYLMMFDDFRRDFLLSPEIWYLDSDEVPGINNEIVKEIKKSILKHGHVLVEKPGNRENSLPDLWMPRISLTMFTNPDQKVNFPIKDYSKSSLKALIALSPNDKKQITGINWDIKILIDTDNKKFPSSTLENGWVIVNSYNTIFNILDVKSKIKHLRSFEEYIHQEKTNGIPISVIVCTRSFNFQLINCINTLSRQCLDSSEFEVIIVNNNPDPDVKIHINQLINDNEIDINFIDCPIPGLSHARNAGISAARGEILVFLDDDSLADPELLKHYKNVYSEHANVGVVGGHIYLKKPEELASNFCLPGWERFWSQFVTGYQDYTEVQNWWEYPWGANWSARREALLKIGGFRTQYGRKGNDFSGGEELVAAQLVKEIGYDIAILPEASVFHDVKPERFTFVHVKNTIRSGIITHYEAQLRLHASQDTSVKNNFKGIGSYLIELLKVLRVDKTSRRPLLLEKKYYLMTYLKLLYRQTYVFFDRLVNNRTKR